MSTHRDFALHCAFGARDGRPARIDVGAPFDPRDRLAALERCAHTEITRHGWQAERVHELEDRLQEQNAGHSWPTSITASGPGFTCHVAFRWRSLTGESSATPEAEQSCQNASKALAAIWAAREAIEQGLSVAAAAMILEATAYDQVISEPEFERALERERQQRNARNSRRPRLPTQRLIRHAVSLGYSSAEEVQNYLETTTEATDEWGLMCIEKSGESFTVEDIDGPKNSDGEYREGVIHPEKLMGLVSKAKAWMKLGNFP